MRSARSVLSAMTLMPTNSATAQRRAMAAAALRGIDMASVRLLQIDEYDIGEEEDADHGGEEDRVAQVDDAFDDRLEVGEERERADRRDQRFGRPVLEEAEDDRRAAHREEKADRGGDDEGDDLVLGQRRKAGADGEEAAGHQERADIAREDDAVIGIAEPGDRQPERE